MLYVFDECTLDTDRRELFRAGEPVVLEPQVFDIILLLIEHRDRVVSNDMLIDEVWDGRIVSDSAITSRVSAGRKAIGDSGRRQSLIRTFVGKGYRFVGEVREAQSGSAHATQGTQRSAQSDESVGGSQHVAFCLTPGGVRLAAAQSGDGPPLVRAAHWVTSIERDWDSPITGPLLRRLSVSHRLLRYDGRGLGLSDRSVGEISPETFLEDLECVVDALEIERFALLGISGGAATAIAYAARHPDRVSKLIIYGGYALGRNKRGTPPDIEGSRILQQILKRGLDDPLWARMTAESFLPVASEDEIAALIELFRAAADAETIAKVRLAVDEIDVADLLARVRAPTLVLHCLRDCIAPFQQGRLLAAAIRNAAFVALDGDNHTLLAREPAWRTLVSEIEAFLSEPADG